MLYRRISGRKSLISVELILDKHEKEMGTKSDQCFNEAR